MLEQTFKALADENRLRIINLLLHGAFCVCELEVILNLSQSNLSRHLGKLKSVGLINARKDGNWVHYMVSEVFKQENGLLLDYLQSNCAQEAPFNEDLKRLNTYTNNNLTCTVIFEKRDQVIEIVNQEESHANGK